MKIQSLLLGLVVTFIGFSFSAQAALTIVMGKDLVKNEDINVISGEKGAVVVFLSARCPCSHSHVDLLKNLAKDHKDFNFVAVHSNSDEPVDMSKEYFTNLNLPFPVIQDDDGKIADQFKALKTPHVFVFARDGETLYKGGVTSSSHAPNADKNYLQEALVDIEAGRKVKVKEGRTLGCLITRR